MSFQNRTLKDKAKRFEEALRKSTDEQIVVRLQNTQTTHAYAPKALKYIYILVGRPGPISAYRGRPEESEGGFGDEEPANSRSGEEDLSAGESGKL